MSPKKPLTKLSQRAIHFRRLVSGGAFTCVESIICVSVDHPFPASPCNRFSEMPHRDQRTNRLEIVVGGPYSGGQSHQKDRDSPRFGAYFCGGALADNL